MFIKTGILLLLWCVFIVTGAQFADAQSKKNAVETPFSMILESGNTGTESARISNPKVNKTPNFASTQRKKTLKTMAGRHLKSGMQASEHSDLSGGRVVVSGLSTEDDANADHIIYEIPMSANKAKVLLSKLETLYGQPDETNGKQRIWHIQNPDMRNGQAKIITMKVSEIGGKLRVEADRTPITRRGELLVKPVRPLSKRGQTLANSVNQEKTKPVQNLPQEVSND